MKKTETKPNIKIVAKNVYQDNGQTLVFICALLRSGKMFTIPVERQILTDTRALHRIFVDKNVKISTNYKVAKDYLDQIIQTESVRAQPLVRQCGWHERTYITPHESYGENKKIQVLDLPDNKKDICLGMRSGNLNGFLKSIAALTRRSSKARLLLGAQCASILAGHVNIGSPTIVHVGGPSGKGKTALIRVAMGVVGRANKDDPKTYAATEAGLEDYFSFFRHALTVIDELGLASNDAAELLKIVQKLAYKFYSGKGTVLSSVYKRSIGQTQRTWAQLAVSSGEKTLKDLQAEAGRKLPGGVLRRMIDIPVSRESGIFDITIKGESLNEEQELKILTTACDKLNRHHGVALPHFVKWIIKHKNLEAEFNRLRDEFIEAIRLESGWHHAVVSTFAVCYAAGVMGIRAGIIPCREGSYSASLQKICYDALQYATAPSDHAEGLAKKLFRAIKDSDQVLVRNKKGKYTGFDADTTLGFIRSHEGEAVAMILARRLSEFTGSERATLSLVQYLKQRNWLVVGSGGKTSQPVDLPAGHGQKRCYRVRLKRQ
jgi:hypothetical protein